MKKILFALIASATTLTAGMSMAHAEGAYAGVGVTASRYKFDVPNVASGDDHSGTKAAGKLFAGYDFNQTWAVEGGYEDFGSRDYNFTQNGGATGSVSTASHGFYVAGKATMPVNDQVGVFGKLGVARNHDSISGSGAAAGLSGDNKTGLYASVGAQYAINKNVSLTAEVEHFGQSADQGHKSTALSLGARYNF
ncbi:outer membrane beta-barrel protein [Janthinobacterium agaricidamnosum]|nr:outer membrane beta-barrel protein [Janthinobacterium agaricidamnosum]